MNVESPEVLRKVREWTETRLHGKARRFTDAECLTFVDEWYSGGIDSFIKNCKETP